MASLAIRRMSSLAGFTVRRMTSPEEVAYALEMGKKEGWRPGIDDAKRYFATDPTGFFVGELDGRMISTCSMVKYDNRFAFGGLYIMDKPYRGKGYGLKMLNAVFASVDHDRYNIGLDGIAHISHLYERRGFRKAWTNSRYQIDASKVLAVGAPSQPALTIKSVSEIDFDKLAKYDATMFGYPRHTFVKNWIAAPYRGFAAVDGSGELLGYAVIRKTARDGEGYRIGPLFANEQNTAHALLHSCAEAASTTPDDQGIAIDVPVELNPQAADLAEQLGGVPTFPTYRMFTKGMPDIPGDMIFGITNVELG